MLRPYDMEKIKAGDKIAFKHFFTFYYPKLMALACRYVDKQVAKDLVQDVFLTFWEQRNAIQPVNLQSYLFKCVQNKCLNYIKHENVVASHEAEVQLAEARTAHFNANWCSNETWKQLMARDIRQRVEESLKKLPARCAEAFRLCFFHDLPHKKVAEIMNISHRTVETHIRQAVTHLREDLRLLVPVLFDVHEN